MTDLCSFAITRKWPAQRPDHIQLYSLPTRNGVKVSILLEETGLPFEPHRVRFDTNDQVSPEFLSLSPNNKTLQAGRPGRPLHGRVAPPAGCAGPAAGRARLDHGQRVRGRQHGHFSVAQQFVRPHKRPPRCARLLEQPKSGLTLPSNFPGTHKIGVMLGLLIYPNQLSPAAYGVTTVMLLSSMPMMAKTRWA